METTLRLDLKLDSETGAVSISAAETFMSPRHPRTWSYSVPIECAGQTLTVICDQWRARSESKKSG